jgi:hypothetical protein
MRKLSCAVFSIIVAACALSLLQFVLSATATAPWVGTYDASGNPKSVFSFGETVNVTAKADWDYIILVVRPDHAVLIIGPVTGGTTYTANHNDLSNKLGWWILILGDMHLEFAVGFFNVIPFAPLGVVGVLGACLVGAGVKLKRKA